MKAVLISIKPKWCELIAIGRKTIEVRKTKPQLKPPFKVYIYSTNTGGALHLACDGLHYHNSYIGRDDPTFINGKVIGEFVCDRCEEILSTPNWYIGPLGSLLDVSEMWAYGRGKLLYGWHIADLVIYDKPKALGEFKRACPDNVRSCAMCRHSGYSGMKCTKLIKAPQSWAYVEECERATEWQNT